MESANWIFDHNNNNGNPNSPARSTNHNNNHSPVSQQSQHFLNFDSPGGHSDVSHSSLSYLNNNNNNYTRSGSSEINSNSNTPDTVHASMLSQKEEMYVHSDLPMDILDPENQHHLHSHSQQHQHHQQQQQQQQHSHQHKDELANWAPIPDLHDLDMNFFPNDQGLMISENSQQHFEEQQLEQNQYQNKPGRIPPTPRSLEISTFQNPHESSFLKSFQSPTVEQNAQISIRPDVVFTPLVSPAVTPMESMINKNHSQKQHPSNFFSPLTSPALEAKSPMKLKKSSSPEESSSSSGSSNTTTTAKKYNKRKTPGNTPIVGPTIPGRIAKQSPVIKAKRSSSYANSITYRQQNQNHSQQSEQPDVMAPPKPRRSKKQSSSKEQSQNGTAPATPATLMNFKMENSSQVPSPLILPQNDSRRSSSATIKQNQSQDVTDDSENPSSSKKTSHKLAEQGRRNRMNQAIQELSCLIPDELSSNVAIPSKATTVEMACLFITNLVKENEYLKEKLKNFNFEIESNESVSPLETTNNHSSS